MEPHDSFSQDVMQALDKRHATPLPRGFFLLGRAVAWALAVLSVLVGGTAFAIAEFVFLDNDGLTKLHGSSLEDIAQSIPFAWLALVALFASFAFYMFRKTRHGYRYATLQVVTGVVVLSIGFGVVLNAIDLGQAICRAFPNLAAPSVDGSD